MDDEKFRDAILSLPVRFGDFDSHAYFFVNEAVTHTVKSLARERNEKGARHVSARELIEGSLDFAVREYGFLAPEVFSYWGLTSGSDLGVIVYRMIDAGILSAGENDRREDFDGPDDLPARLSALLARRPAPPEPTPLPPIA